MHIKARHPIPHLFPRPEIHKVDIFRMKFIIERIDVDVAIECRFGPT